MAATCFYYLSVTFCALIAGWYYRAWLVNWFFTFQTKWKIYLRRRGTDQASQIKFDKLRAGFVICQLADKSFINITEIYNQLVDQDMLSVTRLIACLRDVELSKIYVQFDAPYSFISQEIICETGMAYVKIYESDVCFYQM